MGKGWATIDRSTQLTALPVRHLSPDAQMTEINTEGGSTVSLPGTYGYMSPEQNAGGEIDGHSDPYAMGLILYRMLTGHKPEGSYEPPSKSGVIKRRDAIVAKCLEHEVGDRYCFFHLQPTAQLQVSFVDEKGKQFTPPPPDRAGGKSIYRRPIGDDEMLVTRPHYEPASRHITVREGLLAEDIQVPLVPLPGALQIKSALAADVVESGKIVGKTGDPAPPPSELKSPVSSGK